MDPSSLLKDKRWDPSSEKEVLQLWEREKTYAFDPNSSKKLFVIDTPPPYPSGRPWHIGAAAHYSQIDMIARTARAMGYEVLFPIGIDRNGLPVELYVERKHKTSMRKLGREKFIELCRTALDDLENEMIGIMKRMGLSGRFDDYYRTDSEEYRALTQSTFISHWNKGQVYTATRPNNYCSHCNTTIADAEIVYEDLPSKLVHVRFKVRELGEHIIIATTRPELLCSCQAIIVHPDDSRYVKYHGLHTIIPIYEREVPIKTSTTVKPEFGSGIVMVCSYGDYTDVLLFRQLGLQEIIAIDQVGRMTETAGHYVGMTVAEARREISNDLASKGLTLKVEDILHRTPSCERSRTPIEIIPMNEYYLKQMELKDKLTEIAKQLRFHPEDHRQILLNWIESISLDWPISRRRFYGTEIPIWYCAKCGEPHLPSSHRYHQPWKEKAPFEKCAKCGGREFIGEDRTFDTWMDSSISPLYISRFGSNIALHEKTYPNALRPQGKDIVRTWLYYTILRCYLLTGKVPFHHAWIMGYGVDEKGERMSKSKGNVIDPLPILDRYGSDTFRLWAASEAGLGSDFRCSEARISGSGKFLTKLWNVSRYVLSFPMAKEASPQPSDRWILAELSGLVEECRSGFEDFNFFIPANGIREFTWNLFAAHYMEMVKPRAYGQGFAKSEQEAAWYTLHEVLRSILVLLAPIIPFITERIWRAGYGGRSIHLEAFPDARFDKSMAKSTQRIIDFNSTVWNNKKGRNLSLRDPIDIAVPQELLEYSADLRACHNLR